MKKETLYVSVLRSTLQELIIIL